jgi:hypothetical protein
MYADDENSITLCIRGIALALDELVAELARRDRFR